MKKKNVFIFCVISLLFLSCAKKRNNRQPVVHHIPKENKEQIIPDKNNESADSLIECPAHSSSDNILKHIGHILSYNTETHCPNWVAWNLTADHTYGSVSRDDYDFHEDTKATAPLVFKADITESECGYQRGHMCPAGDNRWSPQAMSDSFFMTNICPQTASLNQDWWRHLEDACRRWANELGQIYICCGPIYENKNKTIGDNAKITVPTSFFKVVLSLKPGEEKAIGFIYRNDNSRQPMAECVKTVDEIENITGYDFFYLIHDEIEDRVEAKSNLKDWN